VSPRILLVEDNLANLELMSYLLRSFGFTLATAENGREGIDAVRSARPDLVICDVHLPLVDGYEVARALKSDPELRSVPIVAVTALAMVGDRERVLSAGFDGYLAKPIDPEHFIAQVREFLPSTNRDCELARSASVSPPISDPDRKYRVLVVDNVLVNIELARSILEPHGYGVIAALGAQDGLECARVYRPDLIVSDVCMDGAEDGYTFIESVKADPGLARIPFLFVTSTMTSEKDRRHGLALGANRFLFRPIEPEVLLAEIEACIAEAGRTGHGDHSDRR
jgi:two-component system cell cycle response regulator